MKKPSHWTRLLAAAALLCQVATAGAVLIEIDDPTLGPNPPDNSAHTDDLKNLTFDTDTGLQWLDLNFTDSLSTNQVLASPLVSTFGFRHATIAEVTTLYEHAGIVDGNGNVYFDATANLGSPNSLTALGLDNAGFQALFSKVETLVFMLGVSGGSTDSKGNIAAGATGTPDPNAPATNTVVAGLFINYSPFTPACCVPQSFGIWLGPNSFSASSTLEANSASGQLSHFLVRDTLASSIPEPATALLLAVGVLGAAGGRRRRSDRAG